MSIVDTCLVLGLALALGWLVLVQRRLTALPLEVWRVAKTERAEVEKKGLAALQEAAAAKAAILVAGIRTYHDQLANNLRAETGAAELRARVVERRSLEVGVALDAASTLVRELRVTLDRVSAPAPAPTVNDDDRHERRTIVERPAPPAIAPPGSAEALPPEPAQKAAGLARPQSVRPHPPPRRATLVGVHPPRRADPAPEEEEDRPSEDEVTRVGPRLPPPTAGTEKTLASMAAVVHAEKKRGAT